MADTPYLRNAYWLFKRWPELQLQLGQFKIPAGGAEFLTEEAQINFIEYSADSPISPFFDRGFMLWGLPLDGIVQYCAGIFTGAGIDYDVNSGDLDDSKDFAGRLLFVPFKNTDIEFIKGFHVGGGYQYGLESIGTKKGEAKNRTEDFNSLWFDWKMQSIDLRRRSRWGAEAHYLYGPFTLSYEYNTVEWHDLTAYDKDEVTLVLPDTYHVGVHQVWASYFLTGEKKQFQDIFFCWRQPKPKNNFSLKNGTWGAFELLARAGFRDSSSTLFKSGILDGSKRGHSITGGINWIANPKIRIMINLNYLKNDDGTYKGVITQGSAKGNATGDKKYLDHELGFVLRFLMTI
jgi:phosphate-selective porin OprO/OprP